MSDYSGSEGGNIPGTNFFLGDGQITSWADECDGEWILLLLIWVWSVRYGNLRSEEHTSELQSPA